MAKRHALGRGLDALMDPGLSESSPMESSSTETPIAEDTTAKVPAAQVPKAEAATAKLPAGISVDENGTLWVDPALLKPNPRQPRKYFDEEKLAELTESIKKEGIVETIVIQDSGDGSFEIIAGERRTRAARAAGLEKVPVQLKKYTN
ncbi:MAG: ParB/RepB/Spo0J family partition protein, partial [Treponema sp.]|nr:ParB/RepB/Spo0J family partition protein [Treponema sp.]